jgi:hypothetical protein
MQNRWKGRKIQIVPVLGMLVFFCLAIDIFYIQDNARKSENSLYSKYTHTGNDARVLLFHSSFPSACKLFKHST